MANPLPLYGPRYAEIYGSATVTMSNEDPDYPIENSQTDDPSQVAKSTTNTTTLSITVPSSTVVLAAVINSNAEAISFASTSFVVPGLDDDGQRIHPWLDKRAAPVTGTSFAMVLSKASGVVWFGRILLLTVVEELAAKYGLKDGVDRPGDVEIVTDMGVEIYNPAELRKRWTTATCDLLESEAALRKMEATAQGARYPFLFIKDEAVNSAQFVKLKAAFSVEVPDYDVRGTALRFEELVNGPVNG